MVQNRQCLPPEVAAVAQRTWTLEESLAYCTRLSLGHYENFPVGSFLVPAGLRPAIHSLYAFMRTADDFSDEGRRPGDEEERLGYLQTWDEMLTDCEHGKAEHPIFIALRATLEKHQLPTVWLHDLLRAFMMDCTVRQYPTFGDLLEYCRYSANPVGRLILTLFGYREEELYRLSDLICTGLQLANHWQDVAIDLEKERVYVPQEDLLRFGVLLDQEAAKPISASFGRLMAFEVERAREFFLQGQSLPDRVRGRLRLELRFTWKGGVRILEKIKQADHDVFRHRPEVTKLDWLSIAVSTLF